METLNQILARNLRLIPDCNFLIAGETALTYRQFSEEAGRLANVLAALGVTKGECVGLYLPSTIFMAVAFWACQRLGAVPAPLSAMLRHAELRGIITASSMQAVVVDDTTRGYFTEIRAEFPDLAFLDGSDDRIAAASPHIADAVCGFDDTASLFFTSGTTGTPKGVVQTQFSIASTLRDMMSGHGARFAAETYLCAVPLFTNFGLTVTLNLCLYTGGTIVLHERWDTERVLADIGRYRATYFGGTPTMYVYMVGAYDPARHDLSSLRLCTTGGAPVPQPIISRFEALSGARVAQVYGSTETCGQNAIEPVTGLRKPGSAGVPIGSSRIVVIDEAGSILPAGQVGEVVIGGDCVARGYLGNDEATAAAFTRLGWRSGDLGYLDTDGYLFLVDRKKDIIISGGHNIQPLEVEMVLYTHPAVAMCAVVGAPDAAKGEVPVAVVVRVAGSDATTEHVRSHCREQLAAYKAPRRVEFIDWMPVEAGKIRKRELLAAIAANDLDRFRRR